MIFVAIANGDMGALWEYDKQGKNIGETVFSSGVSALQVASQYEQFEVVELLLSQGADVSYQVSDWLID